MRHVNNRPPWYSAIDLYPCKRTSIYHKIEKLIKTKNNTNKNDGAIGVAERTYRSEAAKVLNSDTPPRIRIARVHSLRSCILVEECPSICLCLPGLNCFFELKLYLIVSRFRPSFSFAFLPLAYLADI